MLARRRLALYVTLVAAPRPTQTVLLTGATGFVGSALRPLLVQNGWQVRAATRHPETQPPEPGVRWTYCDVDNPSSVESALEGCTRAFYLVHSMSEEGDYHLREQQAALSFAQQAERAGLELIVYLGGVQPISDASKHLASRAKTGAALASLSVPVIELRAAMIVGAASASWQITRDLAFRLPAMVLPRWLSSQSEPVAIDDVVAALLHAIEQSNISGVFGVPGPDVMSARQTLLRVAALRGTKPLTLNIPLLTPRLSSGWVQLVTRANNRLARELVEGLKANLLNSSASYWRVMDHRPMSFEEAARRALRDEQGTSSHAANLVERVAQWLSPGARV